MRRRAPFVNNEVYIIPHFLCVGRVSENFIIIQGAIIFIYGDYFITINLVFVQKL